NSSAALTVTAISISSVVSITDNIFSGNAPIPGETSFNAAGSLYITYANPSPGPSIIPVVDLQRNTFINNQGRLSGASYIGGWGTGFPGFLRTNLLLDGSQFVGNKYLSIDPYIYNYRYDIASTSSNTIMNALYARNEVFYHPIEVTDNPDGSDGNQGILLEKAGSNPEPYKFRSIQAADDFSLRFSNYLSYPLTIVGTIQQDGYFISTVQFELRGKHDDDRLKPQGTLVSDTNGSPLILANSYPTYLKYLNLERNEKSDAKILVQITCGWNDQTSGGICVDS
ncbi:MAG: hypothetical protein EZS28_052747, partial [Streblomastix strix]